MTVRCDLCGLREAWGMDQEGQAFCLECEAKSLESTMAAANASLEILGAAIDAALQGNAHPTDVLELVRARVDAHAHAVERLVGSPPPEDGTMCDLGDRWKRNFDVRRAAGTVEGA